MCACNAGLRVLACSQDCCAKVWAQQGIKGFYGGLVANAVRALPEATIQFACYEALKNLIQANFPSN